MKFRIFIATISTLLVSANAWAVYQANLTYDYAKTGTSTYTFDVTVHNTSTGTDAAPLDLFQIFLNADSNISNYQNITWNSNQSPVWASDLSQPILGFGGSAGNVIAYTQSFGGPTDGIAQGSSLGQFSFSFDYTGTLAPEQQTFGYYATFGTNLVGGIPFGDPLNPDYFFTAETTGNLVANLTPEQPGTVPEPSTLLLLGLGISAAVCLRRKSNC
jgi:hypothetical protein